MAINSKFKADPGAINGLAGLTGRAANAAQLYAAALTNGPNELGEGLLGKLAAPLDRWQELGVANSRQAETLALAYSASLQAAAKLYAGTDVRAAEAIDRTYPGALSERVDAGAVASPGNATSFTDFENASRNPRHPDLPYTGPDNPGEDAFGGWNIELQRISEKLAGGASVAGAVRGFLTKLVGTDLLTVVEKLVVGDWDGLLKQGMAFEDAGIAFGKIKQNIDRGRYGIQELWTGNAGEAARAWLTNYSYACGAHAKFCTEAGWKIKNFARAAYNAMLALDIALDALLDAGLSSLLKLGKKLEAALLGLVGLGDGESLRQALAGIMAEVSGLRTAIDACNALAHTIQSIAEMVAGNGEIAAQSWPGQPYRHPGA